MEKKIETVYVGTMEDTTLHLAKRKGEWNALNSSMNLCHSLKEVRAYLYTPEEHAAVERYKKAVNEIISGVYPSNPNEFMAWVNIAKTICKKAIANPKYVCTCTQGKGFDYDENGREYCINCGNYTKAQEAPILYGMKLDNFHKVVADTPQSVKDEVVADLKKLDNLNVLEQIEQWIEHNWPNSHMIIYPKKDLLDKIEELKKQQWPDQK